MCELVTSLFGIVLSCERLVVISVVCLIILAVSASIFIVKRVEDGQQVHGLEQSVEIYEEPEDPSIITIHFNSGKVLQIVCDFIDYWEFENLAFTGQWDGSGVVVIYDITGNSKREVKRFDSDIKEATVGYSDVEKVFIEGE